ncbi:MAG TPA: EFR1 family ferrodoxin [Mobilitalea sp.]|nr:EFR1 family ferrodoxin [Mobilitalea sp.]
MNTYKIPKKVEIIYFSGTGSTRKVAEQFTASFTEKNIEAANHELNHRDSYTLKKTDMLVIIYPVYATNAPEPIYDFISKLPYELRCPAVVISVSGGGEVTPNKACRLHCINRLEKKGYPVVYEQMIVMPSNFLAATPEELAIRLLEVLPLKTNFIINELLSGVISRTRPDLFNRFLSFAGEIEKTAIAGKSYGKQIKVNSSCNGCGICQKGCPVDNIRIVNKKPVFDRKCSVCLKCIYACPKKALQPTIAKFIVLKQGYPLKDWEKKVNSEKHYSIDELAKGYAFSGIRKYLKEDME